MNVKDIVRIAFIAAMVFVSLFVSIPVGFTMIQISYIVVFALAIAFGSFKAGIGCAIGASLFDISGQWFSYAPFSFCAYFLMAFIVGRATENEFTPKKAYISCGLGAFCAIAIYSVANFIFQGKSAMLTAIPFEIFNFTVATIAGVPLGRMFRNILSKTSF